MYCSPPIPKEKIPYIKANNNSGLSIGSFGAFYKPPQVCTRGKFLGSGQPQITDFKGQGPESVLCQACVVLMFRILSSIFEKQSNKCLYPEIHSNPSPSSSKTLLLLHPRPQAQIQVQIAGTLDPLGNEKKKNKTKLCILFRKMYMCTHIYTNFALDFKFSHLV